MLSGIVLYQAARHRFTARRHAPLTNAVRLGFSTVGVWAIGLATLYLVPRLT